MVRCATSCRVLPALLAVLAAGCSNEPPETHIERQWLETVERLNFTGVYPITEDLQPGDVLLDLPPTPGTAPQPRLRRLGSLEITELRRLLASQEQSRMHLEDRAVSRPGVSQPGVWTLADGRPPLGEDGARAPRLRTVMIPALTAARVYQSDIGGAGIFGTVGLLAGLSARGRAAVHIKLDDLQVLGLDELDAFQALQRNRAKFLERMPPETLLSLVAATDLSVAQRICRDDPPPADRARISIVNRVLYTRSITYEHFGEDGLAGRLAAEVAQGTARPTMPAAGAPPTQGPGAGTVPSGVAGGVERSEANLLAARQNLAAILPSRPGVAMSFGLGRFGGAALTETSDRPLAVGFTPLVSYTVRGSLVVTARKQDATEQVARLVAMCTALLAEESDPISRLYVSVAREGLPPCQKSATDRGQSTATRCFALPIETRVCANSRDFINSASLPDVCGGGYRSWPEHAATLGLAVPPIVSEFRRVVVRPPSRAAR